MNTNKSQAEQLPQDAVKCRFFSLYQFSKVCFKGISNSVWNTGVCTVNGYFVNNGNYGKIYVKDTSPLELKPLSKITDEDAVLMYRGLERNYESANQFLEDYKSIGFLEQSEVDFLRSKGYAVPYMEHSVDELIKMGWVQWV